MKNERRQKKNEKLIKTEEEMQLEHLKWTQMKMGNHFESLGTGSRMAAHADLFVSNQ